MSARQALNEILHEMPEDRVAEVLDFAEYLLERQERREWQASGRAQLARAYGGYEPEYTEADIQRGPC